MVTAAKISADLLANDAKFVDGFNRAATAVGRFAQSAQKDIKQVRRQVDDLIETFTGIRGALGAIATAGGIVLLNKNALEAADAVAKLAEKLGLTTTEIQKYQYAAKQSNVSNDDLQSGFNNLNKLIAEGKVPYSNLNQAIGDIANRMANAKDGSTRAKLAFDAFGKTGVNLIPMFIGGAAALKAFGEEAERIGAVLPQETIERAARFKTEMETLGTVVTKNFQAGLLKEFTDDSGKLRDIYSDPAFIEGVKELGQAFGLAAKGAIAIVTAYQKASTIVAELGLAAGADLGLVDPDVYIASLQEARDRLNPKPNATAKKSVKTPGTPSGSIRLDEKVPPSSQLDKYISQLNQETAAIGLSERALFKQKAVIQGNNAARTDYEQHLRNSPKLTADETAAIEDSAERFYDLKEAQRQATQYNEQFKAGFEDAAASVVNGSKSISDAIKDLVIQFAALIQKQLILQPLADSIFGSKGSGSGVGGLLGAAGIAGAGSFFGSQGSAARVLQTGSAGFVGPLPSFDSGTDYVPHDMTANIHKGEAVLTPGEAESWRNGKQGDTYYIDGTGASKSEITQLKALLLSLAGPGRVEDRFRNARARGAL